MHNTGVASRLFFSQIGAFFKDEDFVVVCEMSGGGESHNSAADNNDIQPLHQGASIVGCDGIRNGCRAKARRIFS